MRELKIKLGITEEKHKTTTEELESAKHQIENLEIKCKELDALNNASTKRLSSILEGDTTAKAKDDNQHELERYKTRVRELEVEISNALNTKKGVCAFTFDIISSGMNYIKIKARVLLFLLSLIGEMLYFMKFKNLFLICKTG